LLGNGHRPNCPCGVQLIPQRIFVLDFS
jgi:hypothetical protein